MKSKFQVAIKKNQESLHMAIRGDFDGGSACRLANLLNDKYDGQGEVVIDTGDLKTISPFGCDTFRVRLDRNAVPSDRLVFRGENAGLIAPEGSKVVPVAGDHHCGCSTRCKNCKCKPN
jgi:hypothetical protein